MSLLFVYFFNKLLKIDNTLNNIRILTVKFVKQLFRIQIQKVGKVLLWNQVKSRMEACYSELILVSHPSQKIYKSRNTLVKTEIIYP